jgi:superfamily II RNA helicase
MNSLPELRRLVDFSAFRQQRHEQVLRRTQAQLQALLGQSSSLDEHLASLHNLLTSHRVQDCLMDRAQLQTLLRRQAVIRRQIQEVRLAREHLEQQCLDIQRVLDEQLDQRRQLQRKHDKYLRYARQLWRGRRLENGRREEREVEDMHGGRR